MNNLNQATETLRVKFRLLRRGEVIEKKDQGVKIALIETPNCIIELMEPLDQNSTVAKFLLRNEGRNGIHHIAFDVNEQLEKVSADLKTLGVEMTDSSPRIGAMGHRINFCHPKFTSNILIELCETG